MELSNLVNTEHHRAQMYHTAPHHHQPQAPAMVVAPMYRQFSTPPQAQQARFPVAGPANQLASGSGPLQQIKLPSIHEIINIPELNYQIVKPSTPSPNGGILTSMTVTSAPVSEASGSSVSSASSANYHYNYKQPQPTQQSTLLQHLINHTTSPVESIVRSPIDSPVYYRSSSTSSSMSLPESSMSTAVAASPYHGHHPHHLAYMAASEQQHHYLQQQAKYSTSKIGIMSRSQNGRKGRSNLPKKTTMILLDWLYKNINHPYPSPKQKSELIHQTGLSSQQLSNWFINARRRKIRSLKFQDDEKYVL